MLYRLYDGLTETVGAYILDIICRGLLILLALGGIAIAWFLLAFLAQANARELIPRARAAVQTPPAGRQVDLITALHQFARKDLENAKASAMAQTPPDTDAAGCYDAWIVLKDANTTEPTPDGQTGPILAFQHLRNLSNKLRGLAENVRGGSINRACAPLILSEIQAINMFMAKMGVAAIIAVPK